MITFSVDINGEPVFDPTTTRVTVRVVINFSVSTAGDARALIDLVAALGDWDPVE